MGTYSSGIDAIFDSMSQAAAESASPPTLRPVSYAAESDATQPSIRLDKMTSKAAEAKRLRKRKGTWVWPALVWSAVAISGLAARGTIVASLDSLGAHGSRPATPSAVAATPAPAATALPPRRSVSHDAIHAEREPAEDTLTSDTHTSDIHPSDGVKPRTKPRTSNARRAPR